MFLTTTGRKCSLRAKSNSERIATQMFFLNQGQDGRALLAQRNENSARISTLVQRIEETIESGEERKLLLRIQEARAPMRDAFRRATDLLLDGEPQQARAIVLNELFPLRERFYD